MAQSVGAQVEKKFKKEGKHRLRVKGLHTFKMENIFPVSLIACGWLVFVCVNLGVTTHLHWGKHEMRKRARKTHGGRPSYKNP